MNLCLNKSITLLELLIAISILGILVIGLSSIDTFSRHQLTVSDRRSRLQNEVSHVLEHMAKKITGTSAAGGAIGDFNNPAVNITSIGSDTTMTIWIDYTPNGRRDTSPTDRQIAYRFDATNYSIGYDSNYPSTYEIIAKRISAFNLNYNNSTNYVEVTPTACWDPDGTPSACGTINNPKVAMTSRIEMPAVSTH